MAMELDIQALSPHQRSVCLNTIGPNTFFMLVADALVSKTTLSVVRMGDGERQLFLHCQNSTETVKPPNSPLDEKWLRQFGCFDIPCAELARRLKSAAEDCTYFAPQIMGIQRPEFRVAEIFAARERYVDNWFVRTWSRKLQDQLLRQAGHVLFIHGNSDLRNRFISRMDGLGGNGDCLEMTTWEQGDGVISQAAENKAPLVLFSGGPANKYIAPAIAMAGKVVLDLGQAAEVEWA